MVNLRLCYHDISSLLFQLNLIINTNRPADILEGSCEFVAGNGPRAACKHLAALCFALMDYDQNKLYEACTQRLQQWHQPTRKSSNPVPLLDIRFTCLYHNKSEENNLKYSQFLASYTYVPKASATLNQLLIKYDQKSTAAVFFLLPREDKLNSLIFLLVLLGQFQIRSILFWILCYQNIIKIMSIFHL